MLFLGCDYFTGKDGVQSPWYDYVFLRCDRGVQRMEGNYFYIRTKTKVRAIALESLFRQGFMNPKYEQDYYLWLKEAAESLQDGHFSKLDIPNLVEEIEDIGRREKRAVESNLVVVLLHLLK